MSRRRRAAAPIAALLALLCLSSAATAAKPQPEARAWTLIDARTGAVLASHAAARHLPIASTTKLMTAYVAMRELPLDKMVRAAPYRPIYGESLLGLRTGQRISVRDLLYGLILRSGNDAAHDLALAAAGSIPRFVAQMNRRAAALGLADTHYANPVGLDQRGNFSSARDLATLTQRLLRIPTFARIADSRSAVLRSVQPPRRISTINELLRDAPWINGVKTGHTFDAGYVLVGSGRRKGVELISVAIGAPTDEARFSDNLELLEYGFGQYRRRSPIQAGQDLADPTIRYSGGELPLRAARAVAVGLRRGQQLSVEVGAPAEVEGPIRRGAPLGTATVFVDGRRAASVPLRAGRSIPEASGFDRARAFLDNHLIPIAIAIFVILMVGVLLYRRLSRRND
ncbi:MAG TPA: D-alanyl-D-alanine carboxypeptidase family protein [Solirubrobacterales bacterium]|jgi:D-alanyl-D-alanine carboxypeptidase|nr:D-alanyl-D-alanine carboxypeptidase family protein [Solirubrobacterales bacterium]